MTTTDEREVSAVQHPHLGVRSAQDLRARQIAEAAEHRLGRRPRSGPGPLRRTMGKALIRVGLALAAEREPAPMPARPR